MKFSKVYKNVGQFCLALLVIGGVASCQDPLAGYKKVLPPLDGESENINVTYVVSDFTGNISGFRCVGSTNVVADMMDCGGPQNVDVILWDQVADVYSQLVNPNTADVMGASKIVGSLNATVAFPPIFFQLMNSPMQDIANTLPWTCENCVLNINGSTFTDMNSTATPMPMTGRAFSGLGPVDTSDSELIQMRMAGCSALQETSGKGAYANKKGTICVNGLVKFKPDFSGMGSSNCSIVLHDPLI